MFALSIKCSQKLDETCPKNCCGYFWTPFLLKNQSSSDLIDANLQRYSSHRGPFSGNARGEVFHWPNKNGTKSSFQILSPVLSLEVGTQGKHFLVHCGSRGAFKTVNLVAKRQFSLDMRLSRPQVPHYVSSKMSGLSRPHKRGESTIPRSSTVKILAFNCRCGSLVP